MRAQNWLVRWFNFIFLCKIAKTHPIPSDEHIYDWLNECKAITCETCGQVYRYPDGSRA